MSLHRLKLPDRVAKKLVHAEPPGRVPRGYFDGLLKPTKDLLDKGFTLAQAADWFIQHGVLKPEKRDKYRNTMAVRFTRFRAQEQQKHAEETEWKIGLGMDSVHAVPHGRTKALCGASSSLWLESTDGQRKCTFCKGKLAHVKPRAA